MIKPYYNQFQRMHMINETPSGNWTAIKLCIMHFRRKILNTNIDIKIKSTAHLKFYEG